MYLVITSVLPRIKEKTSTFVAVEGPPPPPRAHPGRTIVWKIRNRSAGLQRSLKGEMRRAAAAQLQIPIFVSFLARRRVFCSVPRRLWAREASGEVSRRLNRGGGETDG